MFLAAPRNVLFLVLLICGFLSCVPSCSAQMAPGAEKQDKDLKKAASPPEKKNSSPKAFGSTKETSPPSMTTTTATSSVDSTTSPASSGSVSSTTPEPVSMKNPSISTNPLLPVNASTEQQPTVHDPNQESSPNSEAQNTEIAQPGTALNTDAVTMPSEYSVPTGYTNQSDETHEYYNSSLVVDHIQAKALWIELDDLPETVTHEMLSESYRRAATVNLTFPFPFYGHPINNVTIATGGFLYVGYNLHMWLAATQYIAPLMANFKASANSSSSLKYYDNGTMFVVEWRNVHLEDKPQAGNFTFQTILRANGDITFVYREIPIPISQIVEKNHPVKVGISDAYLFKRVVFLLKRKTIYEYHSISKKTDQLASNTAIVIRALPTCVSLTTCEQCTTAQINFNCTWCEAVQRCSSGVDRHRQSWISNKCEEEASTHKEQCRVIVPNALSASGGGNGGGLSALLVVVSLVLVLVGWLVYAYRNPRSASGQLLIKYRPSQWKRHGEARYIAAGSLHM